MQLFKNDIVCKKLENFEMYITWVLFDNKRTRRHTNDVFFINKNKQNFRHFIRNKIF